MHTTLYKSGRSIGTVQLVNGRAVASSVPVSRLMQDTKVIMGGKALKPEDGERYLRALPQTFRSGYLSAVFSA